VGQTVGEGNSIGGCHSSELRLVVGNECRSIARQCSSSRGCLLDMLRQERMLLLSFHMDPKVNKLRLVASIGELTQRFLVFLCPPARGQKWRSYQTNPTDGLHSVGSAACPVESPLSDDSTESPTVESSSIRHTGWQRQKRPPRASIRYATDVLYRALNLYSV
jgi:hypothetical protein